MRIQDHHPQLSGIERGTSCQVTIDGRPFNAFVGETIAAVLFANGRFPTPKTHAGEPGLAGFFCGIGLCYGCQIMVNGRPQRACVTEVRPGMEISISLEPKT